MNQLKFNLRNSKKITGSIILGSKVSFVFIYEGNFKDAEVILSSVDGYYSNNLTLFEESVFGTILLQMNSGTGFISASMAINTFSTFGI